MTCHSLEVFQGSALTKLRIRVGRNENWLEGSINVTMKSLLQHTTCLLIAILKLSGTLAIGRVPDGYFSSEESTALTLLDAIDYCDSHVACAGLTYRSNEDEDEEHDWTVYFHSFLPPLLNNTKEHDWITQRSDKAFVLHPGKLVASDHLMIDLQVDPSSLSLKDAQELCKNHSECVAFSYPINSSQLDGFDDIVFSSSLESIDTTHENWQTLVVNQANKANKTNPESMIYYDGLKEHPYSTCCEPASIDSIPSVQQVQVMDSLSRISCDISPEQFLQEYEFTRTPVMLVGCDEDWPAKTEWTLEKLSERFGNDDSTTWRSKTLDTPQDFDDLTWMEFINEMRQNRTAYIFDDLDDEAKLSIEDDYSWPKPFVDKDLYELDFPPGFGSRHWIGLGNKGSGTSPHKDPFGTDAWNSKCRAYILALEMVSVSICALTLLLNSIFYQQVSLEVTSGGYYILEMLSRTVLSAVIYPVPIESGRHWNGSCPLGKMQPVPPLETGCLPCTYYKSQAKPFMYPKEYIMPS